MAARGSSRVRVDVDRSNVKVVRQHAGMGKGYTLEFVVESFHGEEEEEEKGGKEKQMIVRRSMDELLSLARQVNLDHDREIVLVETGAFSFANAMLVGLISIFLGLGFMVHYGFFLLAFLLVWQRQWIELNFLVPKGARAEVVETYLRDLQNASESNAKIRGLLEAFLEPPLRPDWPGRGGKIDLNIHDLPHPNSQTEWWYYNAHLSCDDGASELVDDISIFICFFRSLKHMDKITGRKCYSHALTWAISDVKNKRYMSDVVLDRDAPELILKSMEEGKSLRDPLLKDALREVLQKGNVPLPDRLFKEKPKVASDRLDITYETSTLKKDEKGRYILRANHWEFDCGFELTFTPEAPAIRNGDHGVVKGLEGDDMFYYFIPKCQVSGTVSIPKLHRRGGSAKKVASEKLLVSGSGWYDHEFGGKELKNINHNTDPTTDGESSKIVKGSETPEQNNRYAWNWTAIQFEDGYQITAALLMNPQTGKLMTSMATVVEPDGNYAQFDVEDGVVLEPVRGKPRSNQDFHPQTNLVESPQESESKHVASSTEKAKAFQRDILEEEEVKDCSEAEDEEKVNALLKRQSMVNEEHDSWWRSMRTFQAYPRAYRLVIPGKYDVDLEIVATFPDQEFMTLIAKPAFWEGRCEVYGTKQGRRIKGLAYFERNGFNKDQNMKTFLINVSKKVLESVAESYPLVPTEEEGIRLIATPETKHYITGVPMDKFGETIIKPVREIADRGGKSWRSYAALACVDCVGGDSRDFVDWIAMPEFLHVGSLIVDDIQDASETRRGGPCAHILYGDAICINAGTAAYFQCEQLISAPGLSDKELIECYKLYFSALRGAHAGQALDIYGLDYMMDEIVETGHVEELEKRILAIHRLKTAVPAGTLARMGALVGKGSKEQIEAIGDYFESIGVAFQIMDDVLNLRGLYANSTDKLKKGTVLKRVGEDIVDGKVTIPVCKAMGKIIHRQERHHLWEIIKSKPQDQTVVDQVIAQLEQLGAIEECIVQAEELVGKAWKRLDPIIPDSFQKMMLRAFGNYVIRR